MALESSTIIAFAVGLVALYVIGLLLVVPIKIILKLIINGIVGGITLLLINFLGGFIGLTIGINPVTAVIVGFLGVPGVVLLFIIQAMT